MPEVCVIQLGVVAALGQELIVAALLNNAPLLQHKNSIGRLDGGKAVRNHNRGALLEQQREVAREGGDLGGTRPAEQAAAAAGATTVAATAATEAAGTWRTCLHRTGFIHHNATATLRLTVHAVDGRLCFCVASHFNKAEAF